MHKQISTIKMLSPFYSMLFAMCTNGTVVDIGEEDIQALSGYTEQENNNTVEMNNPLSSFHPKTEPKIFIDENDVFMAFLNHLKVIDIINRRLQNSKLINLKDYQEYQDEIHEIFALHMYYTCLQLQSDLDKYNDTPTDETIRELECNMLNYDFKKVMMHGFKMRYTPVRVLKFLMMNVEQNVSIFQKRILILTC